MRTAPVKPRIWNRYVDDTFCIVEKGKQLELLEHLNSVSPTIRFTFELEEKGELSFLDCLAWFTESMIDFQSVCIENQHTLISI